MSEEDQKIFIHLFECRACGMDTRADRIVRCFRCGTEMDRVEKIAEIEV